MTTPALPDVSAGARAAALLARPTIDPAASASAQGAAAATLRADIAAARAAAATQAEYGAYERTWQAATVLAEAAERMALARLQLDRALADLPATLDALDATAA